MLKLDCKECSVTKDKIDQIIDVCTDLAFFDDQHRPL